MPESDDKIKEAEIYVTGDVIGGAVGVKARKIQSTDRQSVREWWHEILRDHGRYSCYGIFLVLPSDKQAIRYLTKYGRELHLISNENCLIIALSENEFRYSGFDARIWHKLVDEHVNEGHSLKVAKLFDIDFDKFPCLVLFQNMRSPEHMLVTLKGMEVEEISEKMRVLFSRINQAATNQESPLTAIENYQDRENLREKGQTIVSQLRNITGKAFETAMEAWITSSIK